MKNFTLKELKKFDGKGGFPAYIAFEGKVYDVTGCINWIEGEHFEHLAGKDLTSDMAEAPHGGEVFEGINCVGELKLNG